MTRPDLDALSVSGVRCSVCKDSGEYLNSPTGSWWAHFHHPVDEHDFEPESFLLACTPKETDNA